MNHCIEISCYVFIKVYIQNLHETLPAFKSITVMWALLLRLQSGDKYVKIHACFRHLKVNNCELKRYIILSISKQHTPACDTGHCSRSKIYYPPLMEPESLLPS
jgi:hypothetical protein